MINKKKTFGALLSLVLFLSGCSGVIAPEPAPQPVREEVIVMAADVPLRAEAPVVADPEGAMEEIYTGIEGYIAEDIGLDRLKEIIGVMDLGVEEVYARYSDPKGGLADTVIVKPEPGKEVEVREALYRYIDRRVAEFESYDVLGSLEIAKNAVIFEQGEYNILLMLKDNEAAQVIIDQYIPL